MAADLQASQHPNGQVRRAEATAGSGPRPPRLWAVRLTHIARTIMLLWHRRFLRRVRQGILQFVLVRPVTAVLAVVMELLGVYREGNLSMSSGFLYLSMVNNVSVSVRVRGCGGWRGWPANPHCDAGLSVLPHPVLHGHADTTGAVQAAAKVHVHQGGALLFLLVRRHGGRRGRRMRRWRRGGGAWQEHRRSLASHSPPLPLPRGARRQSCALALLVWFGVLRNIPITEASMDDAGTLQDFFICVEMVLAAVGHHYAFSYTEFQGSSPRTRGLAAAPRAAAPVLTPEPSQTRASLGSRC